MCLTIFQFGMYTGSLFLRSAVCVSWSSSCCLSQASHSQAIYIFLILTVELVFLLPAVQGARPSSDLGAPGFLGDTVTLKVPRLVHHKFEVVVTVNAHGDVVVVLDPLGTADSSVARVFSAITVVLLEGIDELVQDFILGLLARLNVRVHLSVVLLADVVNLDDTTAVLVHDLEGFLSKALSEVVHDTTDTTEEFVVVDFA